jgi:hypothetical protein
MLFCCYGFLENGCYFVVMLKAKMVLMIFQHGWNLFVAGIVSEAGE